MISHFGAIWSINTNFLVTIKILDTIWLPNLSNKPMHTHTWHIIKYSFYLNVISLDPMTKGKYQNLFLGCISFLCRHFIHKNENLIWYKNAFYNLQIFRHNQTTKVGADIFPKLNYPSTLYYSHYCFVL